MDDHALEVAAADQWQATIALRLEERRAHAQAALDEQRNRIRLLESQLDQSLQLLAGELSEQSHQHDQLSRDRQHHEVAQAELTAARQQLLEQQQQLVRQRQEWEQTQLQAVADQQRFTADLQARTLDHHNRQTKLAEQARQLADQQQALVQREQVLSHKQADLETQFDHLEQQRLALAQAEQQLAQRLAACEEQQSRQLGDQLELQRVREELAREQQELAERHRESQKQRRHIAQQLRARKKELAAEVELHRSEILSSAQGQELQLQIRLTELQARFERIQEELAARDAQQLEVEQKLAQQQPALEQAQAEARRLADVLRQAEMQQQVAQGESQRYRDMLAQERETADRQRESLRQQALLAQEKSRSEAQAEMERLRSELQQAQTRQANLEQELSAANLAAEQRIDELRSELAQSGAGQSDIVQRQFKQWEDERSRLQLRIDEQLHERSTLEAELAQLREQQDSQFNETSSSQVLWDAERNRLQAELAEAKLQADQHPVLSAELDRVRAEKKQLEQALLIAQREADNAGNPQEVDDLRRRFEMAVQDVRELKTKNADLNSQLAKAKATGGKPAAGGGATGGAMDWEARKQQMLAKLEAESDDEADEKAQADRLTIEGTIRMTDQIVADKERELTELRKLLEDQSSNIGGLAVGAAAIASMFDGDELIQQERANLKQMQEQMQEQLKRAEIDISVERAKLARERSELDEKLRNLERELTKLPINKEVAASDNKKKSSGGGRWLSRLGLRDGDA
jgi:chromosome segregation ATPase